MTLYGVLILNFFNTIHFLPKVIYFTSLICVYKFFFHVVVKGPRLPYFLLKINHVPKRKLTTLRNFKFTLLLTHCVMFILFGEILLKYKKIKFSIEFLLENLHYITVRVIGTKYIISKFLFYKYKRSIK